MGEALDEGFHGYVHEAVGGDMEDFVNSPGVLGLHKTVDDIAHEWEACGEPPEVEPAAAKSSPHPGLWIAIAFAALVRRRR